MIVAKLLNQNEIVTSCASALQDISLRLKLYEASTFKLEACRVSDNGQVEGLQDIDTIIQQIEMITHVVRVISFALPTQVNQDLCDFLIQHNFKSFAESILYGTSISSKKDEITFF